MSTDNPTPTGPGTPEPAWPPAAGATHGPAVDQIGSGDDEESWFSRHTEILVAAMVALVIAAAAIGGLAYYRGEMDDRNADTEAAFTASVEERGATVETVECDGGTCAAVIEGTAYTVLVQEDEDGEQHFGISSFVGD